MDEHPHDCSVMPGSVEDLRAKCERLEQQVGLLSIRVLGWRTWAQFVYLGGGTVLSDITDADLQRHVCAKHEEQIELAPASRAPFVMMCCCPDWLHCEHPWPQIYRPVVGVRKSRAEEWPCSFGHHVHATREEAVACAAQRR